MLASVVEIEMRPPDPLPQSLPAGTTANDGRWVTRSEVKLTTPPSMRGYWGSWLRVPGSVSQNMIMEPGEIDWPEEGSAPAERRTENMITEDDVKKIFAAATEAHPDGMARLFMGWPLNKGETFAAFALMGLTSRLQPLQVNSGEHQELVVDLALKLGALAAQKSEAK